MEMVGERKKKVIGYRREGEEGHGRERNRLFSGFGVELVPFPLFGPFSVYIGL